MYSVFQDYCNKLYGVVGNITRILIQGIHSVLGGFVHKGIGGDRPALPLSFELCLSAEEYGTFNEHRAGKYAPPLRMGRRKCPSSKKIVSQKAPFERYTGSHLMFTNLHPNLSEYGSLGSLAYPDDKSVANGLAAHYQSSSRFNVSSGNRSLLKRARNVILGCRSFDLGDPMLAKPFSSQEFLLALALLDPKKYPGPDGLHG
ncbi:uncharacterized protein TNCV_3388291 [Trichonephila clavipes]|nr:uncharacterized protein TNCV_3388291 [Trichonephila clavipes]